MGPRYLIIPFMVLFVCSLLVEDVQPKAVSTNLQRVKRNPFVWTEARAALTLVSEVLGVITGSDSLISMFQRNNDDQKFRESATKKLDELISMCKKIDVLSYQIANVEQTIRQSTELIIVENAFQIDKSDLYVIKVKMNHIQREFERFMEHLSQFGEYSRKDRRDLMKSIVDNHYLKADLEDIVLATKKSTKIGEVGSKDIFSMTMSLFEKERRDHQICNDITSYDKLYILYETVLKTVIQGYFMVIIAGSYFIKNPNKNSHAKIEKQLQEEKLISASIGLTETAQMYLRSINNTRYKGSYACDPSEWKEGKNFIRVKNYVGYQDKVPLSPPIYTGDDIVHDCEQYTLFDTNNAFDSRQVIGRACNEPFRKGFKHRPVDPLEDFPELSMEGLQFNGSSCINRRGGTLPYDKECLFDTYSLPTISIRKLSIRPQSCNIKQNEVVTNIRFQEKDGIIRPQIECGVFENGRINPNSRRWYDDDKNIPYKPFEDYVMFLRPVRTFLLDDIEMPIGEFVVGFTFSEYGENETVTFKVEGRRMYTFNNDGRTGAVTTWHFPKIDHERRRIELDIHNLPVVVKQTKQTAEESQSGNHSISLVASDNKQGFKGNLPITPFFNMQAYQPLVLAPLGGLGLFYKSNSGYAGLLSFKFISSTYMHYIDESRIDELAKKLRSGSYSH